MTTPDDPNAPRWNQPQPADETQVVGQPPVAPQYGQPQYGQPPVAPQYGQPQYGQPGAYPQMGYPAATMHGGVPGGVTTASVLLFIFGGFAAIFGLLLLVGGSSIASSDNFGPISGLGGIIAAVGVVLLANAALDIVCGLKIRAAKAWARVAAIVVSSIWLALWIWGMINGNDSTTTTTSSGTRSSGSPVVSLIFIVMTALIIYFLAFDKKSKEFFRHHH